MGKCHLQAGNQPRVSLDAERFELLTIHAQINRCLEGVGLEVDQADRHAERLGGLTRRGVGISLVQGVQRPTAENVDS